jgi:hypothetical protein
VTYVVPSGPGDTSGVSIVPVSSWYSRNDASPGISAPVSKIRLCPLSGNTPGRGRQAVARIDQDPVAITTASAASATTGAIW